MWQDLTLECFRCNRCKLSEAERITPPFLFAGSWEAPVVILNQAPKMFSPNDKRNWFARVRNLQQSVESGIAGANEIEQYYRWELDTHVGVGSELRKAFGDNWLASGDYLFTNAARCRTAYWTPRKMIRECSVYTDQIMQNRRGLIVIGYMVQDVLLKRTQRPVRYNCFVKSEFFDGPVLLLPHWSSIFWDHTIEQIAKLVNTFRSQVGL